MRKLLTILTGTFITGTLMAGGLVTNTNQSAAWVRLPVRDASIDVDAVYYNPAGVMKLDNGLHVSLSNQTIFQTREIKSNYPYLNSGDYKGSVSAPVFPSIYAVYKLNKFAISAGFMPIGGGGGATFNKGLPSFEYGVSDLVPGLTATGIPTTAYSVEMYFKGTSVYYGFQANVSYKINDMLSVAIGGRLVTVKNNYTGYLNNIMINPNYPAFGSSYDGTTMVSAPAFFTAGATTLNTLAAGATSFATGLQPIITGGGGSVLLSDGTEVGLTSGQITQIQQILGAAGLTPAQIGASTIASAQGTLTAAAPGFTSQAGAMSAYAAETANKSVDAEQTGSGISPILSADISPTKNLNIGIKYEFATKISVTNKTSQDIVIGSVDGTPVTMFPDGAKVRNDMPAELAVGVDYTFMKLKICLGVNYFFDKSANYGHTFENSPVSNSQIIAENGYVLEGGLEFNLTKRFALSAGYNYANKGVNSEYQSDLTYSNATSTYAFGGVYSIGNRIKINAGVSYTSYVNDNITVSHYLGETDMMPEETLGKSTFLFGVGLDIKL